MIRGYEGPDEDALLAAWRAALPMDAIDRATFRRKVLLDPNFDADGLLIAEVDGEVAGFCLSLMRREPFDGEMHPELAWITAFGVHPEHRGKGVGSGLLEAALTRLREAGRQSVHIAPYLPNYFVPGVDEVSYADGVAFLKRRGFEVTSRPIAMDARLVKLNVTIRREREETLGKAGIRVRPMEWSDLPALLAFLDESMPYDWRRDARLLLREGADPEQVIVAVRSEEVVGYCQFRGEHFGPFGVRSDMQGRGIGTVLLAKCLEMMRAKGHHNAWVLWTSDETAEKVYSKLGFVETRRFSVMKRRLQY